MDLHEQPTVTWNEAESNQKQASEAGDTAAPKSGGSQRRAPRMSRRKLAGIATLGIVGAGAVVVGGAALEKWESSHGAAANTAQMGHLMRRAGFGMAPGDLATYATYDFSKAVDRLINYQQVPDTTMENRLNALKLNLDTPTTQQQWWLLRMAWTQRPLLEKMTLFWHGVLTSSFHKVGGAKVARRMIVQNQFLRAHAFDTFDNILLGITSDPAMLIFLDLNTSKKTLPNENYARELMELFTLGLGNYTQEDVHEAALALTGWHVAAESTKALYHPQTHNTEIKHLLGQTGNFDYRDVIRILANHPATSWSLCHKLFTFFAYENPSKDDLTPLVETYAKSNHNMGEVMRTLLLSPQFSSPKAYRSRLKSPAEYIVGAYRALNMQGDGASLPAMATLMGQTLFAPPNVAGWPGDKVSALWLNSGTWMTRLNYIDSLLVGERGKQTGTTQALDIQATVNANAIDTPEHFIDYFSSLLLDGVLEQNRRTQFLDYFTAPDSSKTGGSITLTSDKSYPLSRVRGALYLLLTSPEYQLN
ncbi:MAG TPA: DUF1800 domain-containing protein [Ktedonobacteraceae bacterium]|jgi:uncharacterized protein (DUF1800 family)|nr:DUF1800 domain-containing protein [Ktedonobacteraceae bacterium]